MADLVGVAFTLRVATVVVKNVLAGRLQMVRKIPHRARGVRRCLALVWPAIVA
jgi:hypothetical protein